MGGHHYALTYDDRVLAMCLAEAPWTLYEASIFGRWDEHCDGLQAALAHYGLGRN